ncbi:hypothetical protein SAMD00023353_4600280 [Rosellinia necatrix]|uniref:Uncharacterized protein n=1 Tax=Rosellinia necatrix TaxID=77044 RepID=A0A1W2TPF6_ROSNE|nr:hypothetical protein SAMD00023353_4600280 [Rosellinia necatrix]
MDSGRSSVVSFTSPGSWILNGGTRKIPNTYWESLFESDEAGDFLGFDIAPPSSLGAVANRPEGRPLPVPETAEASEGGTNRPPTRASLLVEEDFHTLFENCVPTDERLKDLLQRWVDGNSMQRRLLYCRPFHIVFEEPADSRTTLWPWAPRNKPPAKLVLRSHHELGELLLQRKKSESFARQLASSWPESFGKLVSAEGQPRHFQWHHGVPQLGDDTTIVCRKVAEGANPDLLTVDVSLRPSDNVLWQILPAVYNSVMTMRMVAFLENLFAPTHSNFTSSGGAIGDWFPVQRTTPALHSTGSFGRGDWLCVQLNMRACIPDEAGFRARRFRGGWGVSPRGIGFPLQRQAAKIPDLSPSSSSSSTGRGAAATAQSAVEFLLSVSIVLKKRHRAGAPSALNYNVVVWLDYNNTQLGGGQPGRGAFPDQAAAAADDVGRGLELESCGAGGEGFFHLLLVLAKTIDHWRKCWDSMMDKIDEIISVQLQDTLDRKRWGKLMFDDSLQLSEQYFTVLQLLRIFQNWIGETERGIQSFGEEIIQQCELWKTWRQQHARMDEVEWPLDMDALRRDVAKVEGFFKLRAAPLKERMEKKKEEVASLQDALLNASSLREALKAKTLNLYFGVFTIVTVFFTPLGFIAALWAIPFLDPNYKNPLPSGFIQSFVAVPLLTYALSTAIVLFFWVRSSHRPRGLSWELTYRFLGAIPRAGGQLKRTAQAMYRSGRENIPDPTLA